MAGAGLEPTLMAGASRPAEAVPEVGHVDATERTIALLGFGAGLFLFGAWTAFNLWVIARALARHDDFGLFCPLAMLPLSAPVAVVCLMMLRRHFVYERGSWGEAVRLRRQWFAVFAAFVGTAVLAPALIQYAVLTLAPTMPTPLAVPTPAPAPVADPLPQATMPQPTPPPASPSLRIEPVEPTRPAPRYGGPQQFNRGPLPSGSRAGPVDPVNRGFGGNPAPPLR